MPAAETVIKGAHADLPGVKFWFTDTGGTGVPIVLLHPNTGTVETWEPQIAAFHRPAIGSSRSIARAGAKALPTTVRCEVGSIADDLDALVGHLKLESFHLLGVAGGGFIAMDYAAWRPERYAA